MSNIEQAAAAKKEGNAHFSKKEWDEAIAAYTKAIGLYDKDHSFYSNRSACYAAKEKFEEALADGNKCVELKPDFAKGYSRIGYALFKLDKIEEAKETYQKGLDVDPNNESLKSGLAECEQAKGQSDDGNMFGAQFLQTISLDPELRGFMNDPEFVQKIQLLNKNPQMAMQMGVLNDPKIKKVFEKMMGMQFGAAGDMNDDDHKNNEAGGANPFTEQSTAEQKEKEAAKKEPTPEPEPELTEEEKQELEEKLKREAAAAAHKAAGNALYKEKKFEGAIEEYRKAQAVDPQKAAFVLNESAALFMLEKWDECVACCERAIEVARSNYGGLEWCFKAYVRMGSVEEKRKNLSAAVAYYKKAMVEKGDEALRKKVKKLEKAETKRQEDALLDPELAGKLKSEGNELFSAGKFGAAIEKYTDAIARNPDDHKVYSNRATAFCKLMRWDAAMADCDKCIALDPLFIKAYIRKGKIEHCLKQYHKALAAFREAEAIDGTVQDLIDSKRETMMAIQRRNQSGAISDKERERALQDPEVQAAMNDPEVSSVLLQAQSGDPTILMKAMRDRPHIKDKIELLMAAGVLRLG
eukprot:CAMPEP_0202703630 /NCGR_PEP_ID=MMETSP1385-20130828/16447_1 /ASSEMBLY_ACC=CAM_ASM_000861 /TAXON_ID=933848 /ORGANISM="Elphidium margaritaceum" /LENGTH=580 /DNA_ID=CAMNT_0049361511 /DNA_START=39 /DNA_END=1781 /DNA_ORIENTATION=-